VLVARHFKAVPRPFDSLVSTDRIVNGTSPATTTTMTLDYDSCANFNTLKMDYASQSSNVRSSAIDDVPFTVAGLTGTGDLVSVDCNNYTVLKFQWTAGAGTITFYASNDATNWLSTVAYGSGGGIFQATSTTFGLFYIPVVARYMKVSVSVYTSGTFAGACYASTAGAIPPAASVGASINAINGSTPTSSSANGSTTKCLGVVMGTAVSNIDQSSTAFAGAGNVNGTIVASSAGLGACCAAEINVATLTLGTATGVIFALQESTGGTNFTDIWTSPPITTIGITRVPAIPISGRRRWRCHSYGGTSTTVTATITALELPPGYIVQKQFYDVYSATNTFATIINSVAYSSTAVSTTLSTVTSVANIEGCKNVMVGGLFTGGTPSVAPIYTLQVSADGTNWQSTATTFTPTAAGFFSAVSVNPFAKFSRLIVSTASSGGTAYGVSWLMISGTN